MTQSTLNTCLLAWFYAVNMLLLVAESMKPFNTRNQ